MPGPASAALNEIRELFAFPTEKMRRLPASFHSEMDRGLAGEPSSLKMLPAYIDNPTGKERGEFLALDLGGTNYRVLRVSLLGDGRPPVVGSAKFQLKPEDIAADGTALFDALARSVKRFLAEHGLEGAFDLGFTFSFPIRQHTIAHGELIHWTKGWSAAGVEGRDVVALLNDALSRQGVSGVRAVSLDNDTTGTQVARSYLDPDCDVGCILGTGTNICYREKTAHIRKPIGVYASEFMIVNMESGNFNKDLPRNRFDELLDRESGNSGGQWEEKMVSGKYLGEIVRLVAAEQTARGFLFNGTLPAPLAKRDRFGGELVCAIKEDGSPDAVGVRALLEAGGGVPVAAEDAAALREICWIVSDRAARIAAAVLAATVSKNDPNLRRPHTIAVDGSVFEKHPGFRERIAEALAEILGDRSVLIRLEQTHDGSGLGAAVIAAVAVSQAAANKPRV
jgi:hexokinase